MLRDRIEGKWIDMFGEVFGLCGVKPGMRAAILAESQSRTILVELAELLTIAAFAAFRWKAKLSDKIRSLLTLLCGGLVFILVNCLMLRTISHNTGLIYFSDSMFDSVVIQTALTILWTLIAMATMM